ncbi:DUF1194 domain-containing protein [Mesorhizobium sp. NBSH29]|uniref:DUF1194 domain-containing protein n=1 Tax=Mesorhizobium sp. NBSH29 TaxID=2654249 RepID=UPI001896761B|nr:DUF1194 domain-containing protein [Mesorhizobium sp. NBSH29]QPC88110.1 DUF1194 domain-containing protein [Mesorhizobium sp. NBSH29]
MYALRNAAHALGTVLAVFLPEAYGQAAGAVDVALVLAVDVSLSMSPGELDIQRQGYAAALTDDKVLRAIADGINGRVAVTYFEWAGATTQRVIVPWTVIANRTDAEAVAEKLSAMPHGSARRTSISGALEFGADLFAEIPFRALKRVIDISGDGPNNQGVLVTEMRDRVAAQGITINGLPLMTSGGMSSIYDVSQLDKYYADCVIGGLGAFVVPVNDWSQFPEAIRRKLVLELAGEMPMPPVIKVQYTPPYDCLAGEKLWQRRGWTFDGSR